MPIKIELPQVGESVTEGIIGRWLKGVGDRVEKYDPLVEVVTDKVTMEMPSPYAGVLTAVLVNEGDTVPMGTPIAEMEVSGTAEQPKQAPVAGDAKSRTGTLIHSPYPMGPTGARELETPAAPQEESTAAAKQRFSPVVRRLAEEHKVDLSRVKGTGLGGRVTRDDVMNYVQSAKQAPAATPSPQVAPTASVPSPATPAGADEEVVQLTPVRRIIADNMVKSATQIPQAWSITEVDVTGMVKRREAVKDQFQQREGVPLTYLPFVIKTVVECLKGHPLLNSSWGGDKIILKKRINIGIAVSAPHGLTVPVIHDADRLSIAALAKAVADLTNRGRAGKLTLQDVQGGTFTVNNTGALGSVASQPLISPPQAAILTTEAIVKRPAVIDDAIAIRSIMNVTLTFDHRIMDGGDAGAFTVELKQRLEAIGPNTSVY